MCGAVRYSATAKPANSMVCHCQSCRRSAASPVVAWVTFAKSEFRFTRGTPQEYESSAKVKRQLLRCLWLTAHLRASGHARLLRCDDLQPGCALGVSAHASFVAQRRCWLGEIRRRATNVPAVAIWRSFLSSRPRGLRCAASNSTTQHSSCDCSTSLRSSRTLAIAECAPSKTLIAICAKGRSRCTKNTASDCGTSRAIRMALPSECAGCSSATICPTSISVTHSCRNSGAWVCLSRRPRPRCVMARRNSASSASIAVVSQGNNASIRVLEKLGMRHERMFSMRPDEPEVRLYGRTLEAIQRRVTFSPMTLPIFAPSSTRSSTGRSNCRSPSTMHVEQMCTLGGSSLPQPQLVPLFFLM